MLLLLLLLLVGMDGRLEMAQGSPVQAVGLLVEDAGVNLSCHCLGWWVKLLLLLLLLLLLGLLVRSVKVAEFGLLVEAKLGYRWIARRDGCRWLGELGVCLRVKSGMCLMM